MPIRVAVDAMGGDHAPDVVVDGVLEALSAPEDDLEIVLVGPEATLREALSSRGIDGLDSLHILPRPKCQQVRSAD